MVGFWRGVFLRLKTILVHYPPLAYLYLFGTIGFLLGKIWRSLGYPVRVVFPTAWLPDYRWAILDIFHAIATTHQSGHTPQEIASWFPGAGFAEVHRRHGNDLTAVK
jgi:hypothetical protein